MGSAESPVNTAASGGEKNGRKRARAGGNYSDLPTFEELAQYFQMPAAKACAELGIGLVSLKRACRQFGLLRWPYRKPRSGQQGHASDSSDDMEGCGKDLHLRPTQLGFPSVASCHEVLRPLAQRDTCVLASSLSASAQLASPGRSKPGGCQPVLGTHQGGWGGPQQQGRGGFQSAPASLLPLWDLERLSTLHPLDAAPILSQLLQQGLARASQPSSAWQSQPGTHQPAPSSQLPAIQAAPMRCTIDTEALWQLARQLVEVPGLAGELAAAIGLVVLEMQSLRASG